ncbi:MAG TPA: autotransporter domain-containing protein, partial [Xanthomonadaceae bacterium]|nr:autotransporter domain-containing protein [Xanthomonadaceae bacterium]
TTNPDPEAVELIAAAFGFTNGPSLAGGSDFAFGGACVQANSATFTCGLSPGAFSITSQLTNADPNAGPLGYLALNGGKADPNALYTMLGGANDIFTYAGLAGAGFITPQQAVGGTVVAARTEAGLIDLLHTAGANNVVVINLPDIGKTPEFLGTAGQASITGLVLTFNGQLNAAMAGKNGIIPVDAFGLVNEVLANPGAYGFSDVTHPACGPVIPQLTSVDCGPVGSPDDFHYAPGTNMSFFFADGVHPTGAAQALLAESVIQEIEAPSFVSMLAETPLQTFETLTRGVHNEMQAGTSNRADGSLRTYASIDYSRQRYDATNTSPSLASDNSSLILGADYLVNNEFSLGTSEIFSHQSATFGGGGGFQNNEPMISAFGVWHTPDMYVSLLGSVGQLNLNGIHRVIQLGTMTRTESGSTSGSHTGVELAGGYFFHWDDFKTGPFASISHQRVRVGSYNENGNDSTAMVFGRQERSSTISKLGWELSGDSKMFDSNLHPFARVAWEHEGENSVRDVSAGLVGLNGTFSMPGFQPDSSWWSGELGVAAELGSNFSAYGAYAGQFGNSNVRVDSFNLGLKWTW